MGIQRIDDRWESGEYLQFEDIGRPSKGAVTHVFRTYSRLNGSLLGYVNWKATWRQYVFSPGPNTSFDPKCLTELAEYCRLKTVEHKS